ncbi:Uncharacterised protein [uncultured archaeon]|nr:Uncharacterised protein [uncultured archaeon]
MSSFEEFLQDYEAREIKESEKFIKGLKEGTVSQNEAYPPKDRFVKLKEPTARSTTNIWGEIPFYGSTLVHLVPYYDKKAFDDFHKSHGFTSKDIDKMIDLAKDTGRIQFLIDRPTSYKNLDFLEPLFYELKPPSPMPWPQLLIEKTHKKYLIEFDTLTQVGFSRYIESSALFGGQMSAKDLWATYAFAYIALKTLGYGELAEEIGSLMISNPPEAVRYLNLFADLIVAPQCDTLKSIYNFDRAFLTEAHKLGKPYGAIIDENIPYEIGKFLLNKTVLYPETFDGCMKVIQEYKDLELYKVLGALNEGVKRTNIDIIGDKKVEASEILDNVWKDADKMKLGSEGISFGVSLDIGLIGELAAGLPGTGLLVGLGFQAIDRFWGVKSESLSEKIAKFVSPNYLVTVYDFKKKHALTD